MLRSVTAKEHVCVQHSKRSRKRRVRHTRNRWPAYSAGQVTLSSDHTINHVEADVIAELKQMNRFTRTTAYK